MNTPTLQAQQLRKSYRGKTVVKDVSVDIRAGEIVGLLGPNGAGKTTAFYMITGLVAPEGGRIMLDNRDISRTPIHKRAALGISYLPQEASIFRKLSVADNIMAVLELNRKIKKKQRHEKLESLLQEFHIEHIRNSLGIQLSGGERRRVEIARTLACDPEFILLDEPFAGIDPISVIDLQQLIKHLAHKNIGILITDHNVRETLAICDKAYVMSAGAVICSGDPEHILQHEEVKNVYLGEGFAVQRTAD